MFSVSYDYHKVSLGCWSSQPAAGEATSPLSHEMTWQAAHRAAHNIESMMLVLHTHKTPRKMLTPYQHVLLCRGAHTIHNMSEAHQTHRKNIHGSYAIQKWPVFPLLCLLLPPFTFNGDRGDRWREILTLQPHPPCPSSPPPPFPDVCVLIILVPWLALPLCLLTAPFISI